MSIIYDALKKLEGHNPSTSFSEKSLIKNKKTKYKQKILLIITILLFVVVGERTYNFFRQKKIPASNLAETETRDDNFQRKETPQVKKQKEAAKRTTKNSQLSYKLEGIIFDKENPFAIINGKRIYQGDKINNFTVSEINKDSVKLNNPETGGNKILSISF